MATLQQRNGSFRVLFLYHGKRETFTLGKVSREEAETKSGQIDYLLLRMQQGYVHLPPGVSIVDFLQFDGNPPSDVPANDGGKLTLTQLVDRYLDTHETSLEPTTLEAIRLHFKHLLRLLGPAFPVPDLQLYDLQRYVDQRAKAKGTHQRKLSRATLKKEIVTLRTTWNWGVKMKLVTGRFPYDGLRYPKGIDKPLFRTRKEIERMIAAGGFSEAEIALLYDSLYLQVAEIKDLLAFVKKNAAHGFIYPMFCLAAHTGARRSEMVRLRVADLDLAGKVLTIHERKKAKGRLTTRRVPLSPFLVRVLKAWLKDRPVGPWLFCHAAEVVRSRKRSPTTGHQNEAARATTLVGRRETIHRRLAPEIGAVTTDEAYDHFKRTLRNSKWNVLKGWHVLRHSFISALASKNVDQRLIDEFVGHQSEEQRRRYRHLYPEVKEQAIAAVFG